jgi:hypothetical protein
MESEITLEEAKQELKETIAKLKKGNSTALKEIIDSGLDEDDATGNNENNDKFIWGAFIFLFALFAIVFVANCVSGHLQPNNIDIKQKDFFYLFVFSLALAAYLASTIREVVKVIREAKKPKKHLEWRVLSITAAEASILIFGVILIFRVYIGDRTLISLSAPSDSFIISYLISILVYLMLLHVIAWFTFKPRPWQISK